MQPVIGQPYLTGTSTYGLAMWKSGMSQGKSGQCRRRAFEVIVAQRLYDGGLVLLMCCSWMTVSYNGKCVSSLRTLCNVFISSSSNIDSFRVIHLVSVNSKRAVAKLSPTVNRDAEEVLSLLNCGIE
ncbi:Uncharacterized protein HZ326_11710 [Fusarium oxysporum f. sp. albedinis]|nr:Uncharacterized protein HZ326_11710 [Fusarium oxysporum f. sp. albedinis]